MGASTLGMDAAGPLRFSGALHTVSAPESMSMVFIRAHQLRDASCVLAPPGLSQRSSRLMHGLPGRLDTGLGSMFMKGGASGESPGSFTASSAPTLDTDCMRRPKSFLLIPRDWSPSGANGSFLLVCRHAERGTSLSTGDAQGSDHGMTGMTAPFCG